MSKPVESAVLEIIGNLPAGTNKQEFGSLVTIAVLLSIVVNLFQLNKLCNENMATIARNPSAKQLKMLRREIRRAFVKEHGFVAGLFYFARYGKQTEQAILRTGAEMSAQRMAELQGVV